MHQANAHARELIFKAKMGIPVDPIEVELCRAALKNRMVYCAVGIIPFAPVSGRGIIGPDGGAGCLPTPEHQGTNHGRIQSKGLGRNGY